MKRSLAQNISEYDDKLLDENALKIKIKEYINEFGSDVAKQEVHRFGFILKYFPPEVLDVTDCINGLFEWWDCSIWDPIIFKKIPERIYTDGQFLSLLKGRLEGVRELYRYEAYEEFKKRLCLYAPESIKLFVELEC